MRPHFKLNVLEGDMVSFTEAFLLLAREGGGKDFEHPVFRPTGTDHKLLTLKGRNFFG